MVAATAQGYISPMTALASHALNGMANSVVPPTSGESSLFIAPNDATHIFSEDIYFVKRV